MSDPIEEARALLAKATTHDYEPEPEGKSICVKCGADGWNRHRPCHVDYRPMPRLIRALADECERLRAENSDYQNRDDHEFRASWNDGATGEIETWAIADATPYELAGAQKFVEVAICVREFFRLMATWTLRTENARLRASLKSYQDDAECSCIYPPDGCGCVGCLAADERTTREKAARAEAAKGGA